VFDGIMLQLQTGRCTLPPRPPGLQGHDVGRL